MKPVLRAFLLLLAVVVVLVVGAGVALARRGLSTRTPPTAAEAVAASVMRRLATPASLRDAVNPVPRTDAVMTEALEHFADHCATCHANDGSGNTAMGRSFYPPVPDMRGADTQRLTDGEIFSIIENGIRLTGMPAWGTGTPADERSSWALVHFIRHLPTLTAEEGARMEALNPRSPEAFREEEEARRFLAGDDTAPASDASTETHHDAHH
jgi:mono/diheme cytochrome c family protein